MIGPMIGQVLGLARGLSGGGPGLLIAASLLAGLLAGDGWAGNPLAPGAPIDGATLGVPLAGAARAAVRPCVGRPGEDPLAGAAAAAPEDPPGSLLAAAADLSLRYGGRQTLGGKVDSRLSGPVRVALNAWADTARQLELLVAVPEQAHALVLGRESADTLQDVADTLDRSWDLMAPLFEADERDALPSVVFLVFDRESLRSQVWGDVLQSLVERGRLMGRDAERLVYHPAGLTAFDGSFVLQPSFDMAGNAAAGDDEFRLGNEVAHKFTVAMVWGRYGHVPETLRWGLGYVAEQRLFRSIYSFHRTGFVGVEEHVDWPKRAVAALQEQGKRHRGEPLPLAKMLSDPKSAGRSDKPQLLAWSALDYLLFKEPESLRAMLAELGALHTQGAGSRYVDEYAGERAATREVLERHVAGLSGKQLIKHIKRVK